MKSIISYFLRRIKRKIISALSKKEKITPNRFESFYIQSITPRQVFSTRFLKKRIVVSDSKWYLPTLEEIWGKQIYKFSTSSDKPLIIDCGANIGLSVLYWKYLYPTSRVIAYEPDPQIFQILEANIAEFQHSDVQLVNAAVWIEESVLHFQSDKSVGGRLIMEANDTHTIPVKTIRLRDELMRHIDMLKIDIEGAEFEVIVDCKDLLTNVDHLFIEFHGLRNEKQKLHDMLFILNDAGFRYHLLDANPIPHPFISTERNSFYDLQTNIFAFRE